MGTEFIKRCWEDVIRQDPECHDYLFETPWHELSEDDQQERINSLVDSWTD